MEDLKMDIVTETLDNDGEVRKMLAKMGGVFELYHLTAFTGYRRHKDGTDHKVTVEVLDMGPNPDVAHVPRYVVSVIDRVTNKSATGNGADSLGDAFRIIHWQDLDAD